MKKIALTAIAVLAFASQAYAQDKSDRTYSPQPAAATTTRTTTYNPPVYNSTTTTTNDYAASGLYLGAYGGYGWTDVDTGISSDLNVNGADYGLFAGYKLDRWLHDNMGMNGAIEAFYGWSNADDSDSTAAVTVEKDHEWGVNFRPGLSFLSMGTSINPYGIIGYRRANFETSGAGAAGSGAGDDNYNGMDLGIGTELIAWGNVGLRADYTHTFYKEKHGIDPDEDDLRVGLAYHF